jgi:hypothetical protein
VFRYLCGAVLAMLVGFSQPASAEPGCVGDCDANGSVAINELITLVNIALGSEEPSACVDGVPSGVEVDISLIIQAVNNALSSCVLPTVTPTPPAFLDVSGTWREDQYRLRSSNCHPSLTDAVMSEVQQEPVCDYQLVQDGSDVTAQDCDGIVAMGTVDATGTLQFDFPIEQQTEQGCTIGIHPQESIPLSHSPTVATFTLPITLSGACGGLSSCTIVIQATWTKQ